MDARTQASSREAIASSGRYCCTKDAQSLRSAIRLQAAQAVTDVLSFGALLVLVGTVYRLPRVLRDLRASGSYLLIHTSAKLVFAMHVRGLWRDLVIAGHLALLVLSLALN